MAKSDIERLHSYLLSLPEDNEPMLMEELDGFLAGIVVCPEMIMPSRWLPHVWSETANPEHAPVFDDAKQAQTVTGLIMDHYNSIAESLVTGGGAYQPVFAIDTRNDDVLWEMWAEGFGRAMTLDSASWHAIIASGDIEAISALNGLRSLKAIASGENKLPSAEQDRLTAEAPDLIPAWVEALSRWRLTRATAPIRRSSTKIGRNDPCPCGSGKKYKKCHGLN